MIFLFTFPPGMYKSSSYFASLPVFNIVSIFNRNYSNGCIVICYCDFIYISPMINDLEYLFKCIFEINIFLSGYQIVSLFLLSVYY